MSLTHRPVRSVLVFGALLAVGACGGGGETSQTATTTLASTTTTLPLTTTTTVSVEQIRAQERAADVPIIKALYSGFSDSWFKGSDNGVQFLVDHNYPSERITFQRCKRSWFPDGPTADYREEAVIDEASIERHDGWQVVGGTWDGIVPEGRIYILKVLITADEAGFPLEQRTEQVHVTMHNDQAYFFMDCGR